MKRITILVSLALISLLPNLYGVTLEKGKDGITLKSEKLITRITVINESIVQVQKSEDGKFSHFDDYITVLKPLRVKWSVEKEGDGFCLTTSQLSVKIDKNDLVSFYDKNGKQLTSELSDGSYINLAKEGDYPIRQAFSSQDEALYGLGQFQSGRMNLNGAPLRLAQFNQEIAIPFVVSTNGYGIYWHNYSVTDVNVPRKVFAMKEGAKNVYNATFIPSESGEYNFAMDSKNILEKNRRGKFALLTINGDTVIHYNTVWMPELFSGSKYLEKGKTYNIKATNWGAQSPTKVYCNPPQRNKTTFASKYGTSINYYFIEGDKPKSVISRYTSLTGRAPMFNKAVFGFWQCRERYDSQKSLLTNATEIRKRKIPVDYIVQDWHYYPGPNMSPTWQRSRYPNPKAMVDSLTAMNMKLMVSVWPSVHNDPLLKSRNLMGKKIGTTNYLDFYDPEVCEKYYKMVSDSMFSIGVSSIWLDGSEPENKPREESKTAIASFGEVANIYCLLVNKTMYEGHRKEFEQDRVFNLTRSAYAGQQRYGSAVWSGDVAGTWEQFSEQIPAGLNIAMAGIPYWTTDIGGFFRDLPGFNPVYKDQYTDKNFIELQTRWFQFGTFNPLLRIHGFRSKTEIWRYGAEYESIARKFIDLRYRLLPYIYSSAWQVTKEGKLLMSPLAYNYPNDKKGWDVKNQFFLGESILVNPVTEYGARERELYLPEGEWFNFWDDSLVVGGKNIVAQAPLNSLPIYVKAGSIIPFGQKVQQSAQQDGKPIELKIYRGKDCKYLLYLDDGKSYRYEKGEYQEILAEYSQKDGSLTITSASKGSYEGKQKFVTFKITVAGSEKVKEVKFSGKKLVVKNLGDF